MAIDINIPSQVKTYANLAAFPATGSLKTIFIAEDTNKTYRWTGSVYVEVSAAGATGITIGTTAIASGTVGRVLFEGTGNVVQESANLFWDNTNGRLGINTSTPAYDLELRGARFYHTGKTTTATTTLYNLVDNTSVNKSYVLFGIDIDGSTAGLAGQAGSYLSTGKSGTGTPRPLILHNLDNQPLIFANSNAERMRLDASGNLLLGATNISSARGGVGTKQLIKFGASQQYLELQANTTSTNSGLLFSDASTGNFGLVNYTNTDNMEFYTAAAERMRIFSTGNLAINTTTDAGFKLDVNGTARVQGIATFGATNPIGTESAIFSVNTASNSFIRVYNPNTTAGAGVGIVFTNNLSGNSSSQIWGDGVGTTGNTLIRFVTSIAFSATEKMRIAPTSGNILIGTTTDIASSKLTIESTTQGFLPPRMTTTQKNAIASPATGLQIFDTTLNRPCFYDGTTWITL